MEIFFLDVGQGTSNLILLGNREAIVIDGGDRADLTLLRALKEYKINRLRRVVVSHNDDDHVGGVASILAEYAKVIDEFWFVHDNKLLKTQFWKLLTRFWKKGLVTTSQLRRIERETSSKELFADTSRSLKVNILSPSLVENVLSIQRRDPNATSAILELKVGNRTVVFPGDSSVDQWKEMREAIRTSPIKCDVLAVPHHAGLIGDTSEEDLQWLFKEAVKCRYAVVSVGTANTHGHPRPEVITMLRKLGSHVLCTQITGQCCAKLEAARAKCGKLSIVGRSRFDRDLTSEGNSRNVACAGTVVVHITPQDVTISRLKQHSDHVAALRSHSGGTPLCN